MPLLISCALRSWFCEVLFVAGVVFLCLFCESLVVACPPSWEVFNDCWVFGVVGVGSQDDPLPACLAHKQHSVVQTDRFSVAPTVFSFRRRLEGKEVSATELRKWKGSRKLCDTSRAQVRWSDARLTRGQQRSRDKDMKGDCVLRWEAVLSFYLINKDKWASLRSV